MNTDRFNTAAIAAALACLLVPSAAQAQVWGTLWIEPLAFPAEIPVGSSITADVHYTRPDFWSPIRLGGYDLTLSFDPAVLSVSSVSFGNGLNLGNAADSEPTYQVANGTLNVQEVSYASSLSSQPTGFTVFSVTFTGLATGFTDVAFSRIDLSDQAGLPLTDPANWGNGISVVPEPEAWAAVAGIGLVATGIWRRRCANNR